MDSSVGQMWLVANSLPVGQLALSHQHAQLHHVLGPDEVVPGWDSSTVALSYHI